MSSITIKSVEHLEDSVVFTNKTSSPMEFGKHNLIYGFNGSGKSTISRIFSSLNIGELHSKVPQDLTFRVRLTNTQKITHSDTESPVKGRIFVYNEDFKEVNFRWAEGNANPVFYIGEQQSRLAKEIKSLENKIKDIIQRKEIFTKSKLESETNFNNFKKETAKTILENSFSNTSYNAGHIQKDFENKIYNATYLLSDETLKIYKDALSNTSPLPLLAPLNFREIKLQEILVSLSELLLKTVSNSSADFLLNNEEMRPWIIDGYKYHHDHELSDCLLCGNKITQDRLSLILTKVIDENYKQLEEAVFSLNSQISQNIENIEKFINNETNEHEIDSLIRDDFILKQATFIKHVNEAKSYLTKMKLKLNEKKNNLNSEISSEELPQPAQTVTWEKNILEAQVELEDMIRKHNDIINNFTETQEVTRTKIKQYYLAQYQGEYSAKKETALKASLDFKNVCRDYDESHREKCKKENEISEHGPAANRISNLIAQFLGHNEITITANETAGYSLIRSGKLAKNFLSEGEKTAITICYFLTLLEAEGRELNDLIVVLDDPISSLDSKSINYSFSLLKSQLSKCAQLIILTHNLQFMNEVKKWIKNRNEYRDNKAINAPLFFIDKQSNTAVESPYSKLISLPKLLKNFESEYHYMFFLVLKTKYSECVNSEYIYLLPNCIRKVTEIYLAFKSPGATGLKSIRDSDFLSESKIDQGRLNALSRLCDVESHADNIDDLVSFSEMTIEETHQACDTILRLIENTDATHYTKMVDLCRKDLREDGIHI